MQHDLLQYAPSFRTILVVSVVLRVALILYSEWHDEHALVKYTDVDYRVFSDAARYLLSGEGAQGPFGKWLNVGRYVHLLPFSNSPSLE